MQRIGPIDLAALGGSVTLIDVRERDEYAAGHVTGARCIPLSEFMARLGEVPLNVPVYVICESGSRSARATRFLGERGYDATNVDGGTSAWRQRGLPIVSGIPRVA